MKGNKEKRRRESEKMEITKPGRGGEKVNEKGLGEQNLLKRSVVNQGQKPPPKHVAEARSLSIVCDGMKLLCLVWSLGR